MKSGTVRRAHEMVEHQVRMWMRGQRSTDPVASPSECWPVITVSREFGSLGADVGKRVAEAFGFTFWDQEILHIIAQETGVQERLLETLDEHTRGRIEDFVSEHFFGVKSTIARYVGQVSRVVHSIADHGGAVIVGRGSQFIVDPERALRLRVVCPRERRVRGYADRRGLPLEVAEREVDRIERERQEFHRRYYQRDVNEAAAYDLVVNSGTVPFDKAGELVIAAYRAKFGQAPEAHALGQALTVPEPLVAEMG